MSNSNQGYKEEKNSVDEIIASLSSAEEMETIAHKDLGQELMDRIDSFLDHRNTPSLISLKSLISVDASKVSDMQVHEIMDSMVTLKRNSTDIDEKSINDILILFNRWLATGRSLQDIVAVPEISQATLENSVIQATPETRDKTYEQAQRPVSQMYQPEKADYSSLVQKGEFEFGRGTADNNPDKSVSLYKSS